jgi:hypothetical protein
MKRVLANSNNHTDEWPVLIADVRAAMTRQVAPESEEAQALSARWRQLMMSKVGGDTTLAIKMKLAYFENPEIQARFQARSGLDSKVEEYLMQIWRHSHLALWARHLGTDDARRLDLPDDRMREWLAVVADMRTAMTDGSPPDSDTVQRLLRNWESLVDAFAAGDSDLRNRMLKALESDHDLQSGWALDGELLTFVDRARGSERTQGVTVA